MIPFVRDITFDYGKVDQVSPLIRRVVADNPGPFTYFGTGTYLVGGDEVAVIDPGPLLDAHLAALMPGSSPSSRLTHAATVVGIGVYALALGLTFLLPEPPAELPE